MKIKDLKRLHLNKKEEIRKRLEDFRLTGLDENKIFDEMCFCTLTPQSKARSCWDAIVELKGSGLLHSGDERQIAEVLKKGIRFHNNKAKYIVKNRGLFFGDGLKNRIMNSNDNKEMRNWLIQNVKGYGHKEASHFLRNVGFRDLAILDRHILKHLLEFEVINEIPNSITDKKYLEIEEKFFKFSEKLGIPMDELDLLFWSMEAGEIFK